MSYKQPKEKIKKDLNTLDKPTLDPIVLTDKELRTIAGCGIDGKEGHTPFTVLCCFP